METSRTYFGSGADWARCIARRTHARRGVNRRTNKRQTPGVKGANKAVKTLDGRGM
jgi:hypothetical protein